MGLGLDERIEKFVREHLPDEDEVKGSRLQEVEGTVPELSSEGEITLKSLLFDSGYKEISDNLYVRANANRSVEFFSQYNPKEMSPGFSYIGFESIDNAMEFNDKYKEMVKERGLADSMINNYCLPVAAGVALFTALFIAYAPVRLGAAETTFFVAGAFFASGFLGTIMGKILHGKQAKKTLSNYEGQIITGRNAILKALAYEPKVC